MKVTYLGVGAPINRGKTPINRGGVSINRGTLWLEIIVLTNNLWSECVWHIGQQVQADAEQEVECVKREQQAEGQPQWFLTLNIKAKTLNI